MQRPSFSGLSQDQATRSVFILWVIFNHFSIAEDFSDFLYADATDNALVNSMLGKLKLLALIFPRISSISAMLSLRPLICRVHNIPLGLAN